MRCFALLFFIFASVVALQQEEFTTALPGRLFSRSLATKSNGPGNRCKGITTGVLATGAGCPTKSPVCVTQSIGEVFSGKATYIPLAGEGDKCVVCLRSEDASATHGCAENQKCKNFFGKEVKAGAVGTKCG